MVTIPMWQMAILCLLALPSAAVIVWLTLGWLVETTKTGMRKALDDLRHEAMLRRERRRGNHQTFLHD